jgi:hypothetical protein
MFCSKCGSVISESVSFCPNCGAKIDSNETDASHTPIENATTSVNIENKTKYIKSLRIMSVIGIIYFPLCFFSFINAVAGYATNGQVLSYSFFSFGYAIELSIVALVKGSRYRYNITLLKITGIIGLVVYPIASIFCVFGFSSQADTYDWFVPYYGSLFLGLGYALTFAIITLVKSKIKTT